MKLHCLICPSERKEPQKFENNEQLEKDELPEDFDSIEKLDKHYEEEHPEWRNNNYV